MSERLSERDSSILDLIFDQTQCESQLKDLTEPIKDDVDVKDEDEGNAEEILKSKDLEIEAVKLAEAGKFDEALLKFNESIEIAPHRPSPFNDRAQLYRFLEKDELALSDLERSIDLCGETHQLTKCRALCQRGIIKRKQRNDDGARDDFNEAAKLGSKFARKQLVVLNPYAKLCNQMVTKLLADMK